MKTLQIENISVDELKKIISDIFEQKVAGILPKPEPQVTYLTRKQTADMLGISLVTLNVWTKKGMIKGLRIGTRVRYKSNEVQKALRKMEHNN